MAIIFELVVNFGTDEKAVAAAAELVRQAGHVDVRGIPVPFGDPYTTKLTRPPAHVELSVHMRGFGYGGPGLKPGLDPRSLTSDEITRTGRALYELLRSFSGYRAAIVGWNPESLVDVEDLEADWRSGDPPNYNGLVLADDLCDRWQLGLEWSRFEPGYRWLPYSGSKNLWLSRTNSDLRWSFYASAVGSNVGTTRRCGMIDDFKRLRVSSFLAAVMRSPARRSHLTSGWAGECSGHGRDRQLRCGPAAVPGLLRPEGVRGRSPRPGRPPPQRQVRPEMPRPHDARPRA